jgi:hypothetical protein
VKLDHTSRRTLAARRNFGNHGGSGLSVQHAYRCSEATDVRLRRPQQGANPRDLAGRVGALADPMTRPKHGLRPTVAGLGAYAPLVLGLTSTVPRVAAALALTMALAGCQAREDAPRPSSTPHSPASQGRPIGADPDARFYAVAAAVRFVRGYLSFQAGRLLAEQVPSTTEELLKRLRVPPASRSRQTEIVGARLERIDASSARVTVRVRSVDEQLTYPLPIDLVRRDGRWSVLSAGDDA